MHVLRLSGEMFKRIERNWLYSTVLTLLKGRGGKGGEGRVSLGGGGSFKKGGPGPRGRGGHRASAAKRRGKGERKGSRNPTEVTPSDKNERRSRGRPGKESNGSRMV